MNDSRNKGWEDVEITRPRRTLVRYLREYVKYKDQHGIEHDAMGYVGRVEVTVQVDRIKTNWAGGQYPSSEDVYAEAVDKDGNVYVLSYNTWGDGMGADHAWMRTPPGDEYHVLGDRWASLPLIPAPVQQQKQHQEAGG